MPTTTLKFETKNASQGIKAQMNKTYFDFSTISGD